MRRVAVGLLVGAALGLLVGVAEGDSGGPTPIEVALRAQLRTERAEHGRLGARYRREIRRARARLAHLRAVAAGEARRVAEALTLAATTYGVSRSALARVAACESTHRPWARNGQYLGLFQLGSGFRARSPFFGSTGLDPFSPYANALAAARVVAREGWKQWECKP